MDEIDEHQTIAERYESGDLFVLYFPLQIKTLEKTLVSDSGRVISNYTTPESENETMERISKFRKTNKLKLINIDPVKLLSKEADYKNCCGKPEKFHTEKVIGFRVFLEKL